MWLIMLIILVACFVLAIFLVNKGYRIWMRINGADAMFYSSGKKWTIILVVGVLLFGAITKILGLDSSDESSGEEYRVSYEDSTEMASDAGAMATGGNSGSSSDYYAGGDSAGFQSNDQANSYSDGNANGYAQEDESRSSDDGSDVPMDEYILPYSDSMYYTADDLSVLTPEGLRFARNEIYARHGFIFKAEDLNAYFSEKSWYVGTTPAEDFSDAVFNQYEKANLDLIVAIENGD